MRHSLDMVERKASSIIFWIHRHSRIELNFREFHIFTLVPSPESTKKTMYGYSFVMSGLASVGIYRT